MTLFYSIRFITVTFFGEESKYIKDMEHHGHHVHEAPATMWVPIAILVALVVVVGLLGLIGVVAPGLSPEIFIEEQLHHAFHDIMHGVELVVPHIETGTKIMAGIPRYNARSRTGSPPHRNRDQNNGCRT